MAVSELPGNPNAVWTVKRHSDGKTYIVQHWHTAHVYAIVTAELFQAMTKTDLALFKLKSIQFLDRLCN